MFRSYICLTFSGSNSFMKVLSVWFSPKMKSHKLDKHYYLIKYWIRLNDCQCIEALCKQANLNWKTVRSGVTWIITWHTYIFSAKRQFSQQVWLLLGVSSESPIVEYLMNKSYEQVLYIILGKSGLFWFF